MILHDKSMPQALLQLQELQSDKERVQLLLPLQKTLIRQIINIERGIKRLQRARKRLSRSKSVPRTPSEQFKTRVIKRLIMQCDDRIAIYRHQLFCWRCIGDGIAAIYQSKYSLKQLHFDNQYNQKQDAGFLSGKTGFKQEYKTLVKGIRMGVPVLLCDLTNIIRHGDLCLLGAHEPFLIEMKSSENRNKRTARQQEQFHELGRFFSSDTIENYKGVPLTVRVAVSADEIPYIDVINACIGTAMSADGFSVLSPEPGLRYIAASTQWAMDNQDKHTTLFPAPASPQCVIFPIGSSRNVLSHPFVLTLSPLHAWYVMAGLVNVFVEVDMLEVKRKFKAQGLHCLVVFDGQSSLQLMFDEQDVFKGAWRVSDILFSRFATEFTSLSGFVSEQIRIGDSFNLKDSKVEFDTFAIEILSEWSQTKDHFDK